jgi:hypothetical protein
MIALLEALCRKFDARPRTTGKATWSAKDIDVMTTARAMNRDPEQQTGGEFPESTVESLETWRRDTDREAKRDTARPRRTKR